MLRPDITEAAARLTSGFDVSRELRQLGAHLREGETVYRLAAGVYGSGGGLLAVTNRRVLLLRDGRTGQASEGFPLARISSVHWAGGAGRGAIVVSDAHNTAELGQVEATEGNAVVTFIRSLLPDEPAGEPAGLPGGYAEHDALAALDEELDEHARLLTHDDLVLATAGARSVNGSRNGTIDGARNGTIAAARDGSANAARSGRFAVPMRVRTPPERLDRLPEQKSTAPAADVAEPEIADPMDRFAEAEPVNGHARLAGSPHLGGLSRPGDRNGSDGAGTPDRLYGDGDYADREDHADHDDWGYGGREYPIHEIAEPAAVRGDHAGGDPARGSAPADPTPEWPAGPESPRREEPGGVQASLPGLRGVESSGGTVAGEVPVSTLAEETGGTRIDQTGGRDGVRRGSEPDRTPVSHSGPHRVERGRPAAERPGPAEETSELGPPVGSRRAGVRRGESGSAGKTSGRRSGLAVPDRKWLLIGGAAVLTMAVVGGVVLAASRHDEPVVAAPPAIESAGPVVKVTKVIDGDSIEVEGSATGQVEIVGITAPRSDKEQCGATDSTAFATRTLAGNQVTLITDPTQPKLDKNGRRLASIRTADGLDYATLAAQAGMARYYQGTTPVTQATEIKAAQADAEKDARGLWGPPCNGRTTTKASSSSTAGQSGNSGAASGSSSTRSSNSGAGSASGAGSNSGAGSASGASTSTGSGSGSNSGTGTVSRGNTLTSSGLGD